MLVKGIGLQLQVENRLRQAGVSDVVLKARRLRRRLRGGTFARLVRVIGARSAEADDGVGEIVTGVHRALIVIGVLGIAVDVESIRGGEIKIELVLFEI